MPEGGYISLRSLIQRREIIPPAVTLLTAKLKARLEYNAQLDLADDPLSKWLQLSA